MYIKKYTLSCLLIYSKCPGQALRAGFAVRIYSTLLHQQYLQQPHRWQHHRQQLLLPQFLELCTQIFLTQTSARQVLSYEFIIVYMYVDSLI